MPRRHAALTAARPRRHAGALALALALAVAAAAAAPPAHANGRPPVTNGVFFRPGDNNTIFVRSTFGLLVSQDGGCSFRWTCEQNVGYGGMYDPKYAVAPDGALFATTFDGLRVSRDGGCSFTTATAELPAGAPGRIANMWIDAIAIGPTGAIWVGSSESAKPNDVYRSTDGGVTFTPRGMFSSVIWWKSIAVAPSDAQHVYVAGYQIANPAPAAHLFSTMNDGDAWTESPLTGVQLGGTPVVNVMAVSPANPQVVMIASVGANGPDGDRLYRSADGGATFTEVLATAQAITNVVFRDASNVIAVSGGGSYTSQDGGATFAPAPPSPHLACLGKRPDGTLVGCGPNWDPDFMAVGSSTDGAQWQKLFRFIELAGPLQCPAGTAGHDTCEGMWPGLELQFGVTGPLCGATPDATPPPEPGGGCCDAGTRAPGGGGLLALATSSWILRRRARRAGRPRRDAAA